MNTKTKKILAIALLLVIASAVIITALVMLQSPVKHELMQTQLDGLIAQYNGTRLTTNPGMDTYPAWSPDGRRIFFESRPDVGIRRYGSECYISAMDADGSNLTRLANGTDPVVRSDKIFFRYDNYPNYDLWVMNTDGCTKEYLTSLNATSLISNPTINPNGTKICYCTGHCSDSYWVTLKNGTWVRAKNRTLNWKEETIRLACREGHVAVFVMDIDGGNKTKIVDSDSIRTIQHLSWSPDGRKILFEASPPPIEIYDIWVMDADGRNMNKLTDSGCNTDSMSPVWSPNGEKIAYESQDRNNIDIWIMNPDGSDKKRLTESPTVELFSDWSPDGKRIAYISWSSDGYIYGIKHSYEDESEIWLMTADGSDKERLLSIPHPYGLIGGIVWSPDGTEMVFVLQPNYANSDIYVIDVPVKEE